MKASSRRRYFYDVLSWSGCAVGRYVACTNSTFYPCLGHPEERGTHLRDAPPAVCARW